MEEDLIEDLVIDLVEITGGHDQCNLAWKHLLWI